MQTDDLAAQMVREMQECEGYPTQLISIARRYIEKATSEMFSEEEVKRAINKGWYMVPFLLDDEAEAGTIRDIRAERDRSHDPR